MPAINNNKIDQQTLSEVITRKIAIRNEDYIIVTRKELDIVDSLKFQDTLAEIFKLIGGVALGYALTTCATVGIASAWYLLLMSIIVLIAEFYLSYKSARVINRILE